MPETPTPNNMPGAPAAEQAPEPDVSVDAEISASVEDSPPAPDKPPPTPEKLLELNKALRKEAETKRRKLREVEQQAGADHADAAKLRELLKALGVDSKTGGEFDPKAEVDKLRHEIEAERTERTRAEVARTEKIDPAFVLGATEEEMRESAQRYRDSVNAAIEEALKSSGKTPAAPASTVTSNGKIAGPDQITTRDQLKNLSPAARVKAYQDGRLKELMGTST